MKTYSMRQAARKLGLPVSTLSNYVAVKKLPEPKSVTTGDVTVYLWTEEDIERARQLLPKIANGRKTRHQKGRRNQEAPPRARSTRSASSLRAGLVPHKSRTKKKK